MTTSAKNRPAKPDDLMSRLERLEALLKDGPPRPPSAESGRTGVYPNLEKRLAAIEREIFKLDGYAGPAEDAPALHHCAMPQVPPRGFSADVSPERARLIVIMSKKWVNGTKLRYCFYDTSGLAGGNEQKDIVRRGFDIWKGVGIGIKFEEVQDLAMAEIRIAFMQGDGAWSFLGRDVIDVARQSEPTMNFGWDLREDPREVDVAVHEIGHTLGFPHEHQNPIAGIVWDEEAVYRYFGGAPNHWGRATTEYNVLRKLSTQEVQGSEWDPDSIMHYGFPGGLILEPAPYRAGIRPHGGLSPRDIAQAKAFYPPSIDDASNPELKPFRSQTLSLAPGQQANFTIKPTASRNYTLQTFGGADTVMVLFEDFNGDVRYVKGDDDSGSERNARIAVRLNANRRYVVRLRMYSSFAGGETAVMLW